MKTRCVTRVAAALALAAVLGVAASHTSPVRIHFDRRPLFRIPITVDGTQTSLPVYRGDDFETVAGNFCSAHRVPTDACTEAIVGEAWRHYAAQYRAQPVVLTLNVDLGGGITRPLDFPRGADPMLEAKHFLFQQGLDATRSDVQALTSTLIGKLTRLESPPGLPLFRRFLSLAGVRTSTHVSPPAPTAASNFSAIVDVPVSHWMTGAPEDVARVAHAVEQRDYTGVVAHCQQFSEAALCINDLLGEDAPAPQPASMYTYPIGPQPCSAVPGVPSGYNAALAPPTPMYTRPAGPAPCTDVSAAIGFNQAAVPSGWLPAAVLEPVAVAPESQPQPVCSVEQFDAGMAPMPTVFQQPLMVAAEDATAATPVELEEDTVQEAEAEGDEPTPVAAPARLSTFTLTCIGACGVASLVLTAMLSAKLAAMSSDAAAEAKQQHSAGSTMEDKLRAITDSGEFAPAAEVLRSLDNTNLAPVRVMKPSQAAKATFGSPIPNRRRSVVGGKASKTAAKHNNNNAGNRRHTLGGKSGTNNNTWPSNGLTL